MGLARFLTRLFPIACVTALAAACAGPNQTTVPWRAQPSAQATPPAPSQPETPRGAPVVGLLLPLTGSAAKLGQDFQDAAQLALFDVGDTTVQLVPRDTGDSPDGAVTAAHSAIDAGAQLLIGPLFSRSTSAVAPVASARGVSVLSFSNDSSVAAPGVYILGFRPEEQVARIVDYAGRRGSSRFAALAADDAYGTVAINAWRDAVAKLPGARIVGVERYSANQPDPAAALKRLVGAGGQQPPAAGLMPRVTPPSGAGGNLLTPRTSSSLPPFDSLLIADGGARLRAVVDALPLYNVAGGNTHLLGTMRWQDDPTLFKAQPAQGAWIAAWPPQALDRFVSRFRTVYKRTPAPLAVLAYDGTALASLLAKTPGGFSTEQLTDPQGFTGGSGLFRLRPDGLSEHGLAVLEVRNGDARVIDPAPTSFTGTVASR